MAFIDVGTVGNGRGGASFLIRFRESVVDFSSSAGGVALFLPFSGLVVLVSVTVVFWGTSTEILALAAPSDCGAGFVADSDITGTAEPSADLTFFIVNGSCISSSLRFLEEVAAIVRCRELTIELRAKDNQRKVANLEWKKNGRFPIFLNCISKSGAVIKLSRGVTFEFVAIG